MSVIRLQHGAWTKEDKGMNFVGQRIRVKCETCDHIIITPIIDKKGNVKTTICRDCTKKEKYGEAVKE